MSIGASNVLFIVVFAGSASCINPSNAQLLTGVVIDESGQPVAGAHVIGDGSLTTTLANGQFSLQLARAAVNEPLALQVRAGGYATVNSYLKDRKAAHTSFIMRRIGTHVVVTLPRHGSESVVINAGRASLQIPADSLVYPNGGLVTGDVDVDITYWHPLENLASAPGRLLAEQDGDAPKRLQTFGMADIEVHQGSTMLQVAPRKNLILSATIPQVLQSELAARPATAPQPALYFLNTATALWKLAGTIETGDVTYDAANGLFTGKLPHLTAWNFDGDGNLASNGGCVTGRIVNTCGQPVASAQAKVWFLGYEELKDFDVTGDGSGQYCVNTGVLRPENGPNQVAYYLSGVNPTDSAMCNPLPAACTVCTLEPDYCNFCRYKIEYSVPAGQTVTSIPEMNYVNFPTCNYAGVSDAECHGTCSSPSISLEPCSFCPGTSGGTCYKNPSNGVDVPRLIGGCTALPDIVIDSPCAGGPPPKPIDDCSQAGARHEGQSCTPGPYACCPSSELECSDFICVKKQDP